MGSIPGTNKNIKGGFVWRRFCFCFFNRGGERSFTVLASETVGISLVLQPKTLVVAFDYRCNKY